MSVSVRDNFESKYALSERAATPPSDGRIKVLIVCGSLGVGGAEVQLSRLVPLLNKDIFDVQVAYYTLLTGYPKEVLQKAGIRVTCLAGLEWNKRKFFVSTMKFMKREQFDLVHAWLSSDNHYGRLPALLTGVPVIIGGLRGKRGLEGCWPLIYSLMNLVCDGWIVNSRELKEFAERKMYFIRNSPIKTIRNGLELDIEQRLRRNEITDYDQLKSDRPVIGIIGRLHPIKNHLLFVEMARQLTDAGMDADYWIIGEGEMEDDIRQAIESFCLQDRFKLLGCREDIDVALSRIDIVVLTSDSESCPNAILEAMRASLPVVSTNCTSLESIIEEGRNGFTARVGDARDLAAKVRLLLADKDKRQRMGAHSRAIIERRFSLDAAVRDLEDAYLYFLVNKRGKVPHLQRKLERHAVNRFVEANSLLHPARTTDGE